MQITTAFGPLYIREFVIVENICQESVYKLCKIGVSVQLGLLCTDTTKSSFALSISCFLMRNPVYWCDSKVSCKT